MADGVSDSSPAILLKQPFPDSVLYLDDYNGVTIRLDRLVKEEQQPIPRKGSLSKQQHVDDPIQPETFRQNLDDALTLWRLEKKRGIWIHVPEHLAFVVPHSIELGFSFHSVQDPNLLILSQWLPTDKPSRLPRGPTHQVGVGIVVLSSPASDDRNNGCGHEQHDNKSSSDTKDDATEPRILLVQEQTGPAARRKLWKMPTGLIDPGEDIADAAVRELKEETGLVGTFDGIICLRHAPDGSAGRSVPDLFFVVRVRLLESTNSNPDHRETSHGGQVVTLQQDEIADICWMPLSEYCQQEIWKTSPAYQHLNQAVYNYVMKQRQQFKPLSTDNDDDDGTLLLRPHRLLTGYMPGHNIVYNSK